jgi:hypothetical protein
LLHVGNFCKIVNKGLCIDILCRLRGAVRRKRPEKRRTVSWFLLHDNAPAHRSVLVKDFLTKNDVATLEYPPYPPDLSPTDFHLVAVQRSCPIQMLAGRDGILRQT